MLVWLRQRLPRKEAPLSNDQHHPMSADSNSSTPSVEPHPTPKLKMTRTVTQLQCVSGPMPSADELAKYDALIPGAAERFLVIHEKQIALVEKQAAHRMTLEKIVVNGDNGRSWTGIIVGAIIALGGLAVTYGLAINGHDAVAMAIGIADLATLAGVFVYGTKARSNERANRIQDLAKIKTDDASQE